MRELILTLKGKTKQQILATLAQLAVEIEDENEQGFYSNDTEFEYSFSGEDEIVEDEDDLVEDEDIVEDEELEVAPQPRIIALGMHQKVPSRYKNIRTRRIEREIRRKRIRNF